MAISKLERLGWPSASKRPIMILTISKLQPDQNTKGGKYLGRCSISVVKFRGKATSESKNGSSRCPENWRGWGNGWLHPHSSVLNIQGNCLSKGWKLTRWEGKSSHIQKEMSMVRAEWRRAHPQIIYSTLPKMPRRIRNGICHPRSVQGYYWPTMSRDYVEFVKRC